MSLIEQGLKELPNPQVLAYRSDGLPRTVVAGFAGHDQIQDLIIPGAGTSAQIDKSGATGAKESSAVQRWANQVNFDFLSDSLRFVRLSSGALTTGTSEAAQKPGKSGLAGLAIIPKILWYNARMADFDPARHPTGEAPDGTGLSTSMDPLTFTALRGVPRSRVTDGGVEIPRRATDVGVKKAAGNLATYWDSVLDMAAPLHTRVFHSCQTPNDSVSVSCPWDADRGFAVELTDLQIANGHQGQARARIEFDGGLWSLAVRQDAYVTLEKRRVKTKTVTSSSTGQKAQNGAQPALKDATWEARAEFTNALKPSFKTGTRLFLLVERLAGMLYVTLSDGQNEVSQGYVDFDSIRQPDGSTEQNPKQFHFGENLKFSFLGLSAHIGIGKVVFAEPATSLLDELALLFGVELAGDPVKAAVSRTAPAPGKGGDNGYLRIFPRGWIENGTALEVTESAITLAPTGRGLTSRAASYTITLIADPDGLESPVLTDVLFAIEPQSSLPGYDPLDITPAITGKIQVESGQPPEMQSSQASFTLDLSLLDRLSMPSDAPSGATWRTYLAKYHRLTVGCCWNHEVLIEGALDPFFDGFVFTPSGTANGFQQNSVQVVARDAIMRTKKPWALIDAKYKAGDFLFFETGHLYGGELIQYILRVLFGDAVADSLNGGMGPLAYFPARGMYPLIGNGYGRIGTIAGAIPLLSQGGSGLKFPPLFRQEVLAWILQIAQIDRAVFYWGRAPGSSETKPVPIYGRIPDIARYARQMGVYEIPDCRISATGSGIGPGFASDSIMSSAEARPVPERDFTSVLVLSGKVPENGSGLLPALIAGRASIDPGPVDDPDDTGERTLLIEQDVFIDIPNAQDFVDFMAQVTLDQFLGVEQKEYSITTRGDRRLIWGRELKPLMNANAANGEISARSLDMDSARLQVTRVTHNIDVMGTAPGTAWQTSLAARPIAATGI